MLSEGTTEILNNLSKLFENENIRVCLNNAGKATLITGLCTAAGGLFGGRMGAGIGGLAGTALTTYLSPQYAPLAHVVQQQLNDAQKTSLAHLVRAVLQQLCGAAPHAALPALLQDHAVQTAVISTVLGFVRSQRLAQHNTCTM